MPECRYQTNFFYGIPAFWHLFIPAEASRFYSLLVCSARKTNWAMLHPTELSCNCNLLSYPAPFWTALYELRCCEIRYTPLIYAAFLWAMLYPTELLCSFLSHTSSSDSELHTQHLSEQHCTLLSYAASSWATLHHAELRCTPVSYATSYRASLNLSELHWTVLATMHPYELHIFLCYAAPFWAMLYPTEPCCILHSYAALFWAALNSLAFAAPYCAMLYPAELYCTLLSFTEPSELRCTLLNWVSHF